MKNAKLPCPDNSLRTPANAQLVINLLHVPFYRTLGQTQPVSYLPIAEAAADHRENVDLPPRKAAPKAIFAIIFGFHDQARSEEHTSELQSLMRTSYAVFC